MGSSNELLATLVLLTVSIAAAERHRVVRRQGLYVVGDLKVDESTFHSFLRETDFHFEENDIDFEAKIASHESNAQDIVTEWIIPTKDEESCSNICEAANTFPNSSVQCIATLTRALQGVIVRSTLNQLVNICSNYSGGYDRVYPSLKVSVSDSTPPWGIDRIDGNLDGKFDHDPAAGTGVKVFVVDTGVHCTHIEFGGRCVPGWSSLRADPICDPTDFTCADDDNGHGTHCAGIVGGATVGVARNATIVSVKVFDADGTGPVFRILMAMDWVIEQKENDPSTNMIMSLSLEADAYIPFDIAVQNTVHNSIIVSVAAGNSNTDVCTSSPARVAEAITVGASDSEDSKADFSNFGDCLDIWAPGLDIHSASPSSDSSYTSKDGTSMACPHVSGVLAQIWSRNPTYSRVMVERILLMSAEFGVITTPTDPFLSNVIKPTPPHFSYCEDSSSSCNIYYYHQELCGAYDTTDFYAARDCCACTGVGFISCNDGIKNGYETDTDCGGATCPPCETNSDDSADGCWIQLQCDAPLNTPDNLCINYELVFRQSTSFDFAEPNTWPNCSDTSSDCSDLDVLEQYRNTNGTFVFKMEWPNFRNSTTNPDPFIIWSQSSNPHNSSTVKDYMPIFDSTGTDTCSGLAKSQSAFAHIDGNPGMPMWYCSIGANKEWQGGIPAYNRVPAQTVELFACADHIQSGV